MPYESVLPPGPHDPVLAVVIPVYNEADNLAALLRDWQPVFAATGAPYTIFLIDDGSTDGSLALLQKFQTGDTHLSVHTRSNAGHGPAILKGYGLARDAEWVFQIDSDHQLDPAAFRVLWEKRGEYDLLLAQRKEKHASSARRWLSRISVGIVRLLYGGSVKDANCPYRLMRCVALQAALKKVPPASFAPNILITSWFILKKNRIFTTVVEHRKEDQRPSRMSGYILRGALRSSIQTLLFRLRQ
jgi:dolichol-phosphate mannosyltransferase